jgi:hypothetical protein
MRVYDIAVMLFRAWGAIELIRAVADFIYVFVRITAVVGSTPNLSTVTTASELAGMLVPILTAIMGLIYLVASKPLARFASRFAAVSDAANQF